MLNNFLLHDLETIIKTFRPLSQWSQNAIWCRFDEESRFAMEKDNIVQWTVYMDIGMRWTFTSYSLDVFDTDKHKLTIRIVIWYTNDLYNSRKLIPSFLFMWPNTVSDGMFPYSITIVLGLWDIVSIWVVDCNLVLLNQERWMHITCFTVSNHR